MFPLAKAIYPNQYLVERDKSSLQATKSATFKTHTSILAKRIHCLSETILLPARWNVQLLSRVLQPLPGENKNYRLWGVAIQISSLFFFVITLPFALLSVGVAFPLRLLDHGYRPAIGYLDNSSLPDAKKKTAEGLLLTKDSPFHIRTHNLGFVSSSMSISGDLRSPIERAKELIESIKGDPHSPDIIFFQEAFHEDATKILSEGIKKEFPYLIHSVAPQISGFNSGAMVASKYPIEKVEFQRLNHTLGPERLSPRGIIKICVKSARGPLYLYGIHTQALLGEDRAEVRFKQIEEIKNFMKADLIRNPGLLQILVGDFNTSRVSAWGEDNAKPAGQAEEKVIQRLEQYFDDPYLYDHNPISGERIKETPLFLAADNSRLKEKLVEPSGSWSHGPFADPGWFLSSKMRNDRLKYKRPLPEKAHNVILQKNTWGTPEWRSCQPANTARFDYILFPKEEGQKKLEGRVEIRRTYLPAEIQSASSDHLPVDGKIWIP